MKKLKPSRAVTAFVKITGAPGALLFFKYKLYFENKAAQSKKLPSLARRAFRSMQRAARWLPKT